MLVSKFIFVSQSAWWCLVLWMSVFTCLKIHICLPVWLVVSGSPDVCLHLSQNSYLSPSLAGGVWFSGCLSSLVSKIIFVSQSGWYCPVLRMSVFTCLKIHICLPVCLVVSGSPDVYLHLSQISYLSPSLAGIVRFSRCLSSLVSKFIFVSQSAWWCLVLRMSVFTCLKIHICLPVWLVGSGSSDVCLHLSQNSYLSPSLPGGVWFSGCLSSLVSKFIFVSQSAWWCLVLRMSVFTCLKIHSCLPVCLVVSGSPDVCLHLSQNSYLSPSLAGGVWFSGCLSSLVSKFIFVSQSGWYCPVLRMSVFTCLKIHICLPVCLVVSGSPDVCLHLSQNSYLSPSLAGIVRFSGCLSSFVSKFIFVSQSAWWCLVLRMSVFTCLKIHICLPVCLVVSGSPDVCLHLSQNSYLSPSLPGGVWFSGCLSALVSKFIVVSQSGWYCPVLRMSVFTCLKINICLPVCLVVSGSPDVCLHLSQNSYLSPSLAGIVRFSGCLSSLVSKFIFVSQSGWYCPVLRMSVFTCLKIHICLPVCLVVSGSPDVCLHLSQNSYLSPSLPGGVWFSGCLSSLVSKFIFVSQSAWWCLVLRMSVFTCLKIHICLPVWLVLSGSPDVCLHLSQNS